MHVHACQIRSCRDLALGLYCEDSTLPPRPKGMRTAAYIELITESCCVECGLWDTILTRSPGPHERHPETPTHTHTQTPAGRCNNIRSGQRELAELASGFGKLAHSCCC
jgi:hypothetical protein